MVPNGFYQTLEDVDAKDLEFICFGVPRSGSTLIYQLISALFPVGVAKTHQYCHHRAKTVVSFRDFRDVVVSLWRRTNSQNSYERMRAAEIDEFAGLCLEKVAVLDKYFERGGICPLRYEDFCADPSVIFSSLKSTFAIEVGAETVYQLTCRYSLRKNKEISERLSGFKEVDPATQIHGNHIYRGEIGSWREFVNEDMGARLESLLRPALSRYGYLG